MDTLSTIHWNKTPLNNLITLPAKCGVYIVLAGDKPLYVGRSKNMKARWRNHHMALDVAMRGAEDIMWHPCEEDEAASLEAKLISELEPLLNCHGGETIAIAAKKYYASSVKHVGEGPIVMAECWKCVRCGHIWLANDPTVFPSHCARCKSRTWKI